MQTKYSLLIAVIASQFALNLVLADPIKLTNAQMDTVTAGALNVNATANALSLGQPALTQTYTATQANRYSKDGWTMEAGFGVASAIACCGSLTSVNANTSATADGKFIRINQTGHTFVSPYVTHSTSVTTIVSITPPAWLK